MFYYLHLKGYVYLRLVRDPAGPSFFLSIAEVQSLYLLGHAGFAHALSLASLYKPPTYFIKFRSYAWGALVLALVTTGVTAAMGLAPGLKQFAIKLENLSLVASILALAYVLPERKFWLSFLAIGLFGANLLQSALSGWKEAVMVPLIILGAFLYPNYKRLVLLAGPLVLGFGLFILPLFAETIREQNWRGGQSAESAALTAIGEIQEMSEEELFYGNWAFFVFRLTEMDAFIKYIHNVPENRPFYGLQIIEQGLDHILPRALFPDKPIMEDVVMARVLENGVIEEYSLAKVSAKPQLVVDGYLSFGWIGAWLFCFLAGLVSAFASVQAEKRFGGYIWGTGLMFTGLFPILWRGNCFEFMLNSIFWSFVLMILLQYLFRALGFLKKATP